MKDILIKNKKMFYIGLPLFLVFFVVYMAIFQLETFVRFGFALFTKGGLKVEKISFEEGSNKTKGKIYLKNSKLYGEKKYLIGEIPELTIEYDNWKINEIAIFSPEINFVRKGDSYNIVDIFVSGKKSSKKSTADPIIKVINVYDGDLTYYDDTYTEQIEKKVDNVNGYVKFFEGYNTDLEFKGIGFEDNNENIFVKFDNSTGKNEFSLDLKDINFNDKLFQFAYDSNGAIKDVSGVANLKLKINNEGFFGNGKLENGKARYSDLNMPIDKVNLDIKFLGENINIDGDYLLGSYPGKFKLDYSSKDGVKVGFFLKDIPYSDAEKYKYLGDLNLGFKKLILDKADIVISYKNKLKAEIDFYTKNGDSLGKVNFNSTKGKFIYEDDTFYINDIYSKIFIENELTEREIKGNVKFKDGKGETEFYVLGDQKNLFSDFKIGFDFELAKEKFLFDLKSRILSITGNYNYNDKHLELNQGTDFYLKYDVDKNYLEKINGNLLLNINNYKIKTLLSLKDDILNIESKFDRKQKNSLGEVDAKVDLKTLDYLINFDIKNLKLSDEKGTLAGNYKGKIENKNGVLDGQGFIEKGTIYDKTNKIALRRIYGIFNIGNKNKDEFIDLSFDGEIGKLKAQGKTLEGIKTSVRYFNNKIEINEFANRHIGISGTYNLNTMFLDANLKLNEITNEVLKLEKIDLDIMEAEGNISGDTSKGLDNLVGEIDVKDANLKLFLDKDIDLKGKIKIAKNEVYSNKFLIGNNSLDFKYSLKNEKGNYKVIIDENEIINVIPNTRLRVNGQSTGEITKGKVRGKFYTEVRGLKAGDKYLPKLVLIGNYNNEGVEFKNIGFLLADKRITPNINGFIDIKEGQLSFDLPKQKIRIKDFGMIENLDGNLTVEGHINGPLSDPNYEFISEKGDIYFIKKYLGDLKFKITGNKELLNIEKAEFLDKTNKISLNGNYDIASGLANIKANASVNDLSELNIVLEKYGIKNLNGKTKLKFEIKDNVPKGELLVEKLSGDFGVYNLYLKNINGKLLLDEKRIKIDTLTGKVNNGGLKVFGDIVYNENQDTIFASPFEKMQYNLVLEGRNIDYLYKDLAKINFSTRLRLAKNYIGGTVNINGGKINNITTKDFGILQKIKDFLYRKQKDEPIVIKNLEAPMVRGVEDPSSEMKVKIRINNENGIKIDIKSISGYVTDIKGEIHNSGILSGTLENLNFLGETNIKEGEFSINGNKFYVDRAVALFNDKNQNLLKANPDIVFITKTTLNSKIYEISLVGPARKMDMYIKSGNEISISEVNSFLSDGGRNSSDGSENTTAFLTEIIGGQISDIVISPIANAVRDIFGLSDLRVTSSVISQEKKKSENDDSSMAFGAYIEAESPIYKDKLFWKAKFNFIDTTDTSNTNASMKNLVEQDLSIYYKINKNLTFGGGIQKLRNDIDIFESDKNNYIEFKFEKKFDL